MQNGLVLRDIHSAPPPPWWPPAPGWWILFALLLLALAAALAWWLHRRRRRRRIERLFDDAIAQADTPAEQVAAMSELLRRAARRRDPRADTLGDEDWLRLLDAGQATPRFAGGRGRLLLEGGYRREVDAGAVEALRRAARARFLEWMDTR
jgi:hypothetical protein